VVKQALQSREQTGLALLKLLERRLDNIIYRLGLARTRIQARQVVTHGHVHVNGEPVNFPSSLMQPGEEIQMNAAISQIPDLRELDEAKQPVPQWLEQRDYGGVVLREPNREEIDPDIQEQRIVEFYSR
jgi:small subunit ribosomal protein S4